MKHALFASCLLLTPVLLRAAPVPALTPAQPQISEERFRFTLESGWRRDALSWTIGEEGGPNILSDLDWSRLNIVPVTLRGDFSLPRDWRLQLSVTYGSILSGRNQDSDFDSSNRRDEFSRSTAETGGHVLDAEVLLGRDFHLSSALTLTPWIGATFNQQHLNDRNGVQQIDTEGGGLGSFGGLDSTYEARWLGLTAGLDAAMQLTDDVRLTLGARYSWLDYEADGDWNLRPELDSFKHTATGHSLQLRAAAEWAFAPDWSLECAAFYRVASTGSGTDRSHFTDGSSAATRLNEVEWSSYGLTAGVTWRF